MENKYKIWYQTLLCFDDMPESRTLAEERIKAVAGQEFEYTVGGVDRGITGLDYMFIEHVINHQVLQKCIQAEKEGYDAILIACFTDPVITELREVLDIPVIGLMEASAMWAGIYGSRAAIVAYTPTLKYKRYAENIKKYELQNMFNPTIAFDATIEEVAGALTFPGPIMKKFDTACREAVAAGADVIIPGCATLNNLSQMHDYTRVGETGALVIDAIGCAIKTAEAAVQLHKNSKMMTSRAGFYQSPGKDMFKKACELLNED